MLKSIRLKNFKLHEDTSIEAAPITVFIGPNNSGKSSIFQALLLLKQATLDHGRRHLLFSHPRQGPSMQESGGFAKVDPFLYPPERLVDLGEFHDVVGRQSQDLQIGLEGDLQPPDVPSDPIRKAGTFRLGFDLSVHNNLLTRHEGWLKVNYGEARWGFPRPVPTAKLIAGGAEIVLNSLPNFQLLQVNASFPGIVEAERQQEVQLFTDFLRGAPIELLKSLHPVFPLRGFEEWAYPTTEFPAGESLDRLVLSDRSVAMPNRLAANAKLKTEISDRLKELVDIGIDFENTSLRRVKVFATSGKAGSPATLFVNEGSGASQLPFILVPLALAKPGETILLSEPEAHLHPKKQSDLTGLLLTISKKRQLQFFIETHSEHVLHKILHAVAKDELAIDELALYYFENENGKARVRQLEVDGKGGVKGGLPGFFDQSLTELSDYLDALKGTK